MLSLGMFAVAAFALGQVSAKEYDIMNCTAYNLPDHVHHAWSYDCREFFNCDTKGGGKRTHCPAGTLYDRETYVCSMTARCPTWDQEACYTNQFNQVRTQRTVSFPGLCCREYYEYECNENIDKAVWTHKYCNFNHQFDPSQRQCVLNFQGNCQHCDPNKGALPANPCNATHMEYVSECEFRFTHKDINTVMRCPQGTRMSEKKCMCVGDVDQFKCGYKIEGCSEADKAEMRFTTGRFWVPRAKMGMYVAMKNGASVPPNANSLELPTKEAYALIYHFMGNSLMPETAFRLSFTPDNAFNNNQFGGETYVMSTGPPNDQKCADGTRVSITMTNQGGQVRVTFKVETQEEKNKTPSQASISATVPRSGSIQVMVGVSQEVTETASVEGAKPYYILKGRLRTNGGGQQEMTGSARVQFFDRPINNACGIELGRFKGKITEFANWRCDNAVAIASDF